jgi:hypothetical protein
LPAHLLETTKTLAHAARIKAVPIKARTTIDVVRYAIRDPGKRHPVSPVTLRLSKTLRAGATPISPLAGRLPVLPVAESPFEGFVTPASSQQAQERNPAVALRTRSPASQDRDRPSSIASDKSPTW